MTAQKNRNLFRVAWSIPQAIYAHNLRTVINLLLCEFLSTAVLYYVSHPPLPPFPWSGKPDVLRPGIVGIGGSMVLIRLMTLVSPPSPQ